MDLSLIGREVRRNSERWFPKLHETEDLMVFYSLALAGEVGEICNLVKKNMRYSDFDLEAIRLEIADVFTYLLLLADELHIDLFDAFQEKQMICEKRWGHGE
jgi:NTP pyrophosphatase (non-canonical NTP hydrolase)